MSAELLSVGYVAKRCGVAVSTLHFYEEKGLIYSMRDQANRRQYRKEVLRRIGVIKAAQKMGISLNSIKAALATLPNNRTPTQADWKKLARKWDRDLDNRIEYLMRLKSQLTGCIGCGCLSMKSCPIYNENDKLGENEKGPVCIEQGLSILD